jgi:cell division protease FtsH
MVPPGPPRPSAPPPAKRATPFPHSWWLAIFLLIGAVLYFVVPEPPKAINLTEFGRISADGQIKKLDLIGKQRAEGEVRDAQSDKVKDLKIVGGKFAVNLAATQDQTPLIAKLQEQDAAYRKQLKAENPTDTTPEIEISVRDEAPAFLGPLLWTMLPILLLVGFFVFWLLPRMRDPNGGMQNSFTRSLAKRYEVSRHRVSADDVAGMDSAKRELQEIVEFLKNPEKFARLGAQVPKGVLLVGPPGTGKTLLAKAVAGEANVPFFSINGSEFIQLYVGVGASRVRDLFKTAKESAPCVIFIDEIDAVGRMRGAGVGGGSDEREQTLNQILGEMDGFQPTETVIVIAATNRPDVLDTALLRPGRFDRHVTVDKPTWQGRLAILKVHTRNKPLDDAVDLERIARNMFGMSGADLRSLCNEAALNATRDGKAKIEQIDFNLAADRVRLGAMREEKYGEEEKRRTAYHEAGHALCAWFEPKTHPLNRVSIIPRGRTGGVTMFTPDEDRVDMSFSELLAQLVVAMGGRAADKIAYGESLSGEIGDLKQATRIARLMVTQYGMSEKLGPVHYRAGEEHIFLGKDIAESRDFSEGTARVIDEEVQRLLTTAEQRAISLLNEHRDDLEKLTNALVQNEELDRDAVQELLKKPLPPSTDNPPPGKLAFGST